MRERGVANYGDWTVMVRALAKDDYDKAKLVLGWPLREALVAFVSLMKQRALEQYRNDLLVWAMLAPHQKKKSKPPTPPDVLKNG